MIKLYCKKCGFEVEKDWSFCPKCKANLQDENLETNKEVILEKQRKESKGSNICICMFLINVIFLFKFDDYKWIFFLGALISIVTGFIKFQNNKIIKVMFWLFLTAVAIYILLILAIIITCGNALSRVDCSGIG